MPLLSSFKRHSVSSTKSTKSSNSFLLISSHPSPLDVTHALNIQSSSPTPSLVSTTLNHGGYAEMLEDDNTSWGVTKTSNPRSRRFKGGSFRFF